MTMSDGLSMDEFGGPPIVRGVLNGGARDAVMASLNFVLAQAPVAVVGCDGLGRIVLVAGAAVGSLGVASSDIIGQYACDVWRHAPPVVAALRGALDGIAARVVVAAGTRMYDVSLTPCWSDGALVGVVNVATDVTARIDMERDLRHRATHDVLTQLPNRALYADRLDQALRAATRAGNHISIVLLDLDGFKVVNDTYGHATGDAMLVDVALRLARTVRASDTVARLGGDEFGVVLPATDSGGAQRLIAQIRASLAAVLVCNGVTARVGVSAGVAVWPDHGNDAASLLGYADAALYRAKRSATDISTMLLGDACHDG